MMTGSRVVLVLDFIERPVAGDDGLLRLRLSLTGLHGLLHNLAKTAVDELGSVVFPLVCENLLPPILGPNFEISFGDRSLNTMVQLPASFKRPQAAHDMPWANINTPEDTDAHDLALRDAVLRHGIESMLRQNEYDQIETEIAELPIPATSLGSFGLTGSDQREIQTAPKSGTGE
jgi:hypothetical protein